MINLSYKCKVLINSAEKDYLLCHFSLNISLVKKTIINIVKVMTDRTEVVRQNIFQLIKLILFNNFSSLKRTIYLGFAFISFNYQQVAGTSYQSIESPELDDLISNNNYIAYKNFKNLKNYYENSFKNAAKQKNTGELFDISLECHKAGLHNLANQSGFNAIEELNNSRSLLFIAQEFFNVNLSTLKSQAARKAIDRLQEDHQIRNFDAIRILTKINEDNLIDRIFTHFFVESSDWYELYETYKILKCINSEEKSVLCFTKLLQILEKNEKNNLWLLDIAYYCGEKKYIEDSKYAMKLAIKKLDSSSYLLNTIKLSKKFGFQDLVLEGESKFLEEFTKHTSLDIINSCEFLIEIGENNCALQLCDIAFKTKLQNIGELSNFVKILLLLHEKTTNNAYRSNIVEESLQKAIQLCKPGESTIFWRFNGKAINFYESSDCLLMLSEISQKYNHSSLSQQAANGAIICALTYPYYDTLNEFLLSLKNLENNFTILQFPHLKQKVKYYKSEIVNPSIIEIPLLYPKPFDIYWVRLGDTKGAEIKKTRPCIVVSKPIQYTKGTMVTVIPLSTKKSQRMTSVPLYLNDVYQEARLDQIRSIDVSRILAHKEELPTLYKSQLSLTQKHIHP